MFKRFTCMILSLVLLLALLPAGVIEASAASRTTSGTAVTILKKVELFDGTCNKDGYIGYGTKCTESGKHGSHKIREDEASAALKEELKKLDTAVNTFASNNKISLSQHQHDALVLFTFRNGQAWMNGSDDLRTAVIQGTKGNAFINCMINWRGATDVAYRKVLANMYLNDKYNSSAPANYVKVTYDANGGKLETSKTEFYYDKNLGESALQVPTRSGYRFAGWFLKSDDTKLVTKVTGNLELKARWQADSIKPEDGQTIVTDVTLSGQYQTYSGKAGGKKESWKVGGEVKTIRWYVDANGDEWLLLTRSSELDGKPHGLDLSPYLWIKWRSIKTAAAYADKETSSDDAVNENRVKVTVTNGYINVREKANIFSAKVGTVYQGDVLRITDTTEHGGYLWGKYVDKNYKKVGYVALMYTNYDELISAAEEEETVTKPVDTVVAKAVVTAKAYVNVRDGAGTHNNIISSLRKDAQVDLYETKYVNGQQWGRCKAGWFSLAYADVTRLKSESTSSDIGFQSYVFSAELKTIDWIYGTPGDGNSRITDTSKIKAKVGDTVSITNITAVGNETWGKIADGWICLTKGTTAETVAELAAAKFTTVAETSVRETPNNSAKRINTLDVGTEIEVKLLVADQDTIWGYADDIQIGDKSYKGWVNLSLKYVSRNGVKIEEEKKDDDDTIYKLATVVNCVEVNIRDMADIWGTKVGTLPVGTTVIVREGPVNGTAKTGWYRLKVTNAHGTESWVRGDYLDIHKGTADEVTLNKKPTSPDGSQAATGRGMVANTYGGVNVRVAPGTANAKVTKLLPGTEVDIFEVTYHGATQWGRIEQGWICMDYIAMMDYDDLPDASATVVTKAVYTGKTNTADVKVHASAESASEVVRTLEVGSAVTLHELLKVTEYEDKVKADGEDGTIIETKISYWARVNDGYINLPQKVVTLDSLDEAVYTVTDTDMLKVREKAGADNKREDLDLMKGDQVKVTDLAIVMGDYWGKIEHEDLTDGSGWICLSYCTKGAIEIAENKPEGEGGSSNDNPAAQPMPMSTGNTGVGNYSGKIIGADEVRVRKDATTNSAEVTTLKKGTAITITETKLMDGRSWGYCGSGWINLLYVDLTPVGITAIDAKVIAVDNTLVYESSETGAKVVGSYTNRAVVNIYEEMNGMYKTDMGWISKGNCL